jgi:phage terminase small subunit
MTLKAPQPNQVTTRDAFAESRGIKMASTLTAKQAAFVQEYLIDLNATQAAIRAGYSENTAKEIGCENLSKPNIATAIQDAMAARSERTEITQDQVLREYAKLGFSDIRKAVRWGAVPEGRDENGNAEWPVEMVPSMNIDDDTAAAISEVSLTAQGLKIKMADKKGALDSMARHLGMFNDKVDHTSSDGTMTPRPAIGADLTSLSDEELAQLERLTDKTRNSEGMGKAD